MKIQDYCKAVDRLEQRPACREEVIAMAKRGDIRLTRKSRIAFGAAAAAIVLAVNGGIGYAVWQAKQQSKLPAGMSGTEGILSKSSENYVQCLRQLYESRSGEPCDFDFTGMGKDCDNTWVLSDFTVTLRAVAGSDRMLYIFYDVTPQKPMTPEEYDACGEKPYVRANVSSSEKDTDDQGYFNQGITGYRNELYSTEGGSYHYASLITRSCGESFLGTTLGFLPIWSPDNMGGNFNDCTVKTDFLTETPMHEIPVPVQAQHVSSETGQPVDLPLLFGSYSPFGAMLTNWAGSDGQPYGGNGFGEPYMPGTVQAVYWNGTTEMIPVMDVSSLNGLYGEDSNFTAENPYLFAVVIYAKPVDMKQTAFINIDRIDEDAFLKADNFVVFNDKDSSLFLNYIANVSYEFTTDRFRATVLLNGQEIESTVQFEEEALKQGKGSPLSIRIQQEWPKGKNTLTVKLEILDENDNSIPIIGQDARNLGDPTRAEVQTAFYSFTDSITMSVTPEGDIPEAANSSSREDAYVLPLATELEQAGQMPAEGWQEDGTCNMNVTSKYEPGLYRVTASYDGKEIPFRVADREEAMSHIVRVSEDNAVTESDYGEEIWLTTVLPLSFKPEFVAGKQLEVRLQSIDNPEQEPMSIKCVLLGPGETPQSPDDASEIPVPADMPE